MSHTILIENKTKTHAHLNRYRKNIWTKSNTFSSQKYKRSQKQEETPQPGFLKNLQKKILRLNGERLDVSPLKSGCTCHFCSTLYRKFQSVQLVKKKWKKGEKEKGREKGKQGGTEGRRQGLYWIRKEEAKSSQFTDDIVLYLDHLQRTIKANK